MKHNYFKVCEWCGAHLDPAERCDCRGADRKEQEPFFFRPGRIAANAVTMTAELRHKERNGEYGRVTV